MWREFLRTSLPSLHERVIADAADHAHVAVDFLVRESENDLLRIEAVNQFLHDPRQPNSWPWFLVAFASNGCGDYFAYDLRYPELPVRYIDPDHTVWENLTELDQLLFGSFSEWYDLKVRAGHDARSGG